MIANVKELKQAGNLMKKKNHLTLSSSFISSPSTVGQFEEIFSTGRYLSHVFPRMITYQTVVFLSIQINMNIACIVPEVCAVGSKAIVYVFIDDDWLNSS